MDSCKSGSYAKQCQHQGTEDTALGPCASTGKPFGSGWRRGEKVMADELPAVGHPVEIALCPVPAHVGANGPPKRSAPIHAIRKHQAGNNGIANPNSLFSAVAEVAQAEKESDHRGCGTKADAFCQGEQGVAPREHFLAETHEGEDGDP